MVPPRWVLGILVKNYRPARPILYVIPDRSAATLIPIINYHCKPGSTITTDCWAAYQQLSRLHTHRTVNHSTNFVDPTTGL